MEKQKSDTISHNSFYSGKLLYKFVEKYRSLTGIAETEIKMEIDKWKVGWN